MTKKTIVRTVGASLAAVLSLAAQPARAQGSDAERLQKLEQAVSQLQKRNAELEQEVSGLKKRTSWTPVVGAEGKTKAEVTSDGKTYVEKLVPDLASAEKWKLFPAITELELFGDLRLRYEYRGGRLPSNDPDHPNDWQERERERGRQEQLMREKASRSTPAAPPAPQEPRALPSRRVATGAVAVLVLVGVVVVRVHRT